ncbi:MAG: hypothetical protein WBG86_21385, partial [Polyangiales bacterium]
MDPWAILDKSRWEPLRRFVERWYVEPLGETSLPFKKVEAVEAKLGCPIPLVVKEWYVLVGHRLDDANQDRAVRLEQQQLRDGRLHLWWENQGNWSIEVAAGSSDEDLPVFVEGDTFAQETPATVTEALLGMVYSDTLVGAYSGCGAGPLGKLGLTVVGGYVDRLAPGVEPRVGVLPRLDVWPNPYFDKPAYGHEALVVRHNGAAWEWMAATADAQAEAARVLGLSEANEGFVLVLSLPELDAAGAAAARALMERG